MKPAETVIAYARQQTEKSDLQKAADTAVACSVAMWSAIADQMRVIGELTQQYGKDAILSTVPTEVATAFDEALTDIKALWEKHSSYPFPEILDTLPVQE